MTAIIREPNFNYGSLENETFKYLKGLLEWLDQLCSLLRLVLGDPPYFVA